MPYLAQHLCPSGVGALRQQCARLNDGVRFRNPDGRLVVTGERLPGDSGGRYRYTGTGDVNTYALFAEHFLNLTREGGGAGLIVPTGIATDATTAPFFGHLVSSQRLAGLVDFENSAPLFEGVHRSFKFCLLTIGSGVTEAKFSFFLTDPAQLEQAERRFTLSPAQIARINPNTKTAPVFRSRRDAEASRVFRRRFHLSHATISRFSLAA